MKWRWDQGRLDYFRFDNIVRIARVLSDLENTDIRTREIDPLRLELTRRTGLPFAPTHYRVWRNYGRVFECSLLATSIDNRLIITDICRRLASLDGSLFSVDEFLSLFIQRFSYPFPAFQDYNIREQQIFPLCAVIKMLLAKMAASSQASLQLEDVFAYVIGNECTGLENVEDFIRLPRTKRTPQGDERRQVRELLIFCSQLNLLKWFNNTLFLDLDPKDEESYLALMELATPVIIDREPLPAAQLLHISTLKDTATLVIPIHTRENPADFVFTEGRRVRVTHLRAERSPRLRRIYFENHQPPFLCDMCSFNLDIRYPWTSNILELHHLLPLSSAIAIDGHGTSLSDVEPLCPNCHKSVHIYYGNFFQGNNRDDFNSREEARDIYSQAKRTISI